MYSRLITRVKVAVTWVNLATAMLLLLFSGRPIAAQTVVAWGSNLSGQSNVPATATNVIAVAAGANHSLALREDGVVVAWGNNSTGQTNVPPAATDVIAIAAGANHNLALRMDGTVVAWGSNTAGQTNVPVSATNIVAIAAGDNHCLALRADGSILAWGSNSHGQTNVPPMTGNVQAIAAGGDKSFALRDDGSVTSWGAPLGIRIQFLPSLVAVAARGLQTLALQWDGRVRAWGTAPSVPSAVTDVVAVAAGTNFGLALKSSASVLAWGSGTVTNVPANATNIIAIAAGNAHALAIRADGHPRIMDTIRYDTHAAVAAPLPLAVRATGRSPLHYHWLADGVPIPGNNTRFPQIPALLGTDDVSYQVVVSNSLGSVTSAPVKVAIRSISTWGFRQKIYRLDRVPAALTNSVAIAAGAFHCLALNDEGEVFAWGKNVDGQSSVPADATNAVAVAAGSDLSLALRGDGSVVA